MNGHAIKPGTLPWFATHELSLAWRDFMRMASAGRKGRERQILIFMILAFGGLHALAYGALQPVFNGAYLSQKTMLVGISMSVILTLSLMTSQAMELVTRVFYSRSDLDLILSSPVDNRVLFTVRILSITIATSLLSIGLFGPAINVMAYHHGWQWLAGYPVLLTCGAVATAFSLTLTVGLFKIFGAKRTRLISQIVAAVVGAGFVIGIQLAAIASLGSISRFELLASESFLATLPPLDSSLWIPARAVMGEVIAFATCAMAGLGALYLAISGFSGSFASHVLAAAGASRNTKSVTSNMPMFQKRSMASALRRKEWKLILRDPWLVSQTLMQLLYLLPPAFMLWQSYGDGGMGIVAVPVLVMACGQLAGGLAWLAISGEDAPQLVKTAPLASSAILRGKIEAVVGAVAFITLPILALMAWFDLRMAFIAAIGIAMATASATLIQMWFRAQAKRSSFRRRQTSSKVATLTEAFSSILWAAVSGLLIAGMWSTAAIVIPVIAIVLWTARNFRPVENSSF